MSRISSPISRRSLLGASAAAVAATAVAGCATALADEAPVASSVLSWLGAAPEVTDADCSEIVDTEVLVVGAGTAGYFAAGTAAEEGARTIFIDCSEMGFGIRGSALGAVDSQLQLSQGIAIDNKLLAVK